MRRLRSERAALSRLRANIPRSPTRKTDAERITGFLQAKYIERYKSGEPPEPFDWDANLERVRRVFIKRGDDPDARY